MTSGALVRGADCRCGIPRPTTATRFIAARAAQSRAAPSRGRRRRTPTRRSTHTSSDPTRDRESCLLVTRNDDDELVGVYNVSRDRARRVPERLPRLLRVRAARGPRVDARRDAARVRARLRRSSDCTGCRRTSSRTTPPRARCWRRPAGARRASRRATSTSTARGATTSCTRSPPRTCAPRRDLGRSASSDAARSSPPDAGVRRTGRLASAVERNIRNRGGRTRART